MFAQSTRPEDRICFDVFHVVVSKPNFPPTDSGFTRKCTEKHIGKLRARTEIRNCY